MEHYRIAWSDETCLDMCKCGGMPSTIKLSLYTTKCDNPDCRIVAQADEYFEVMVKWNKEQRK